MAPPPSYNQTLANDLRKLMEEPLEQAVQVLADQSLAAHASSDKKFPSDILADIEVLAKDGEEINKRFLRLQDVLSHSKLESASSSFDNLYKVYEDLFLNSKKISGKATGDAVDFSSTICSFVLRPAVPLEQKLTEIGLLIENYQGKAQDAGDQRKKFFVLCDELDAFAQELAKEVEDDGSYKPKPEAVSILQNIEKKQAEIEKINGMILDPLQTYLGIAKGAAKALFSACPKAADTTLAKVSDVVDKFSPKVGDIKAQTDLRNKLHQEIIKLKTDLGTIERAQQLRKTYVAFPSIVKNLSEDLRAYAKRLGPFTDVYQQLVTELESWVFAFDQGQDPTQGVLFKARVGANVAIAAHAAKAFEIFATAV